MNPLNIKPERFLVAEEEEEEEEEGEKRAQGEKKKRKEIVAFGQLAELEHGALFELRSLVTAPEWRGMGIGAELVRRLLAEAAAAAASGKAAAAASGETAAEVVLTTISRRREFYERLGFEEVPPSSSSEIPMQLRLEVAVGSVVARLAAGDSLIVLRKRV